MAELKFVMSDDVKPQNIRGLGREAGQVKRIVATDKFYFNIDEINPGYSPHSWHRHTKYRHEGIEVEYPSDFEEIYYIVSGHGIVQWKNADGRIEEQPVGPGDTIYFPPDVIEHQLLNNGTEMIRLAVVGVPPPKRTPVGK